MTLRFFMSGIICAVVGVISAWSYGLQMPTTAIPSEFAFAGIELLRDDETISSNGPGAETTETYARPLFSGNRRPYQPAERMEQEVVPAPPVMVEEDAPVVDAERPQLKLLGTEPVAKTPSALITMEETGTSSWFHKGDLIVGWRITRIGIDDIELSNETDRSVSFNISLYPDTR
jgi:hypothetical protein